MSSAFRHLALVVGGILLVFARMASAQDADAPPVVAPDRPDLCNGIQIVPVGHVQVEGGATVARAGGTTDITAGELMLRVPFSSRVETRMQLFTFDWSRSPQGTRGALGPLVDLKWKIFDSESTDFGVIVGTAIPVGASAYRERHFEPYGVLALDQKISERLSVTGNAGVAGTGASGKTVGLVSGGLSFGLQASEKAALFLEGFAWDRTGAGEPGEKLIDGGLQYLLNARLMVDARAGATFGRTTSGAFVGVGGAVLF